MSLDQIILAASTTAAGHHSAQSSLLHVRRPRSLSFTSRWRAAR